MLQVNFNNCTIPSIYFYPRNFHFLNYFHGFIDTKNIPLQLLNIQKSVETQMIKLHLLPLFIVLVTSQNTIFHSDNHDTVIAEVEESFDEQTNQPIIVINLPDLLGQFSDDFDEFAEEEGIFTEDEDLLNQEDHPQQIPDSLNPQDKLNASTNTSELENESDNLNKSQSTQSSEREPLRQQINMTETNLKNDTNSQLQQPEVNQTSSSVPKHIDSTVGDILDHSMNSKHKNIEIQITRNPFDSPSQPVQQPIQKKPVGTPINSKKGLKN